MTFALVLIYWTSNDQGWTHRGYHEQLSAFQSRSIVTFTPSAQDASVIFFLQSQVGYDGVDIVATDVYLVISVSCGHNKDSRNAQAW